MNACIIVSAVHSPGSNNTHSNHNQRAEKAIQSHISCHDNLSFCCFKGICGFNFKPGILE